jgi:predicted TIM-barrel fold metal-dependent hydrolase
MRIIDADTHIDETEDTWEFLLPDEQEVKPTTGYPSNPDPSRPATRYWLIDNHRQPRFTRNDSKTCTTVETRELLDVDARLRDMDKMGVEVQVIYPTLFLVGVTERPEVDLAIKRSYNRWLGERSDRSRGRLRWVCLPPCSNMDQALDELRFAKEHGACGVLKKGDREAGKWPSDPYFFPLYEEAERLDMPICFHIGSGVPDFTSVREFSHGRFIKLGMPVPHAFQTLIVHGVPNKFPKLRWGFIEAGASWVPFVLYELRRRLAKIHISESGIGGPAYQLPENILRDNRFYVTIQVDEDLPYLLQHTGEDNLLVGSDYSHGDSSNEMEFPRLLQERADRGDIPQSAVQKILYDNAKTFYGL